MRNSLCSLAKKQGLGIGCMYPASINRIRELEDRFPGKSFPAAERVAETIFTVPTHQLLSKKDRENILQFLKVNWSGAEKNKEKFLAEAQRLRGETSTSSVESPSRTLAE
jgi:hypothetical protein